VYGEPALVPASPWLDRRAPAAPRVAVRTDATSAARVVDLDPGVGGPATSAPWLYVLQTRSAEGWKTQILPASQRVALLAAPGAALPLDVRVTAVDRVGNAGPAARATP
jgi:hypothetical protein